MKLVSPKHFDYLDREFCELLCGRESLLSAEEAQEILDGVRTLNGFEFQIRTTAGRAHERLLAIVKQRNAA
ncbi:hypothetical protein [Ferrimonas senticii]|uniref:hypothetical protein n=1 Tax=Ferrimonas senticii TaxID=394566 RepID=UPI000411B04D|nr:hypothetical protein [Ferrimonas senticii]